MPKEIRRRMANVFGDGSSKYSTKRSIMITNFGNNHQKMVKGRKFR